MQLEKISAAETAEELLLLYDEQFLWCAYRTIMGRTPDETGLKTYLALLRSGEDRLTVVQDLAFSEEGRRFAAKGGLSFAIPAPTLLERVIRRFRRAWFHRLKIVSSRRYMTQAENRLGRQLNEVLARLDAGQSGGGLRKSVSKGLASDGDDLERIATLSPSAQSIYFRLRAQAILNVEPDA